ncbi:Rpn family recombination-promoting nuclease/putative transposase [Desulfallas thermosapovorans]|uniref:Putative transposase/invertase (TIGR01784 family) n=1 Tax=Desulfallas thermosapovorans DSM 6562 TaxID=1121431 RepID=A0A5S4ZS83_9FIRM|nr:Rpn family recombination-promoting nuclease/putative transposase [Desulfallas thermosapovorans]TYO95508.1 putative transposase/invertase (TIGR01784 family) [Desulfallas thermosapovorans DSM 6562]
MSDRTELETVPPHHPHDKGYRQLLNNKRTFLELLQTFVLEGWVREIKEDDLTLVNKTYVQQDFSDKEADIVYRTRLGGTEVIFYVLLELQSTVDHTMPFRLLQYMVEIWRDVYKNTPEKERKRKNFRLPPIVPAVLYNGKRGWTACRSFRDYQSGQEHFPGNLLDFTYILFDVVRYSEEDLHRAANMVSSVFYLDQTVDPSELVDRLKKLAGVMKEMDPEQFRQIIVWLRNVIKRKLPKPLQNEIDRVLDETELLEVEKMITNIERTLDEMQKAAEARGMEKGRMKGKVEGKLEGKLEGKVETARAALMEGLNVEIVSKITGLTLETVLELKKELEN